VSKDGGKNWENVTPKDCPKAMMWNCVEVDPFKKGAAYFVGTRYKSDDFTPYIYKTEDYGKTWKLIVNGINRLHFARAIRADRKRAGLLYTGTEYGMYISYDDGNSWKSFQLNLPVVPITDLAIKNNDLIVGTQGRSIYILDDLTVIQQMNSGVLNKNLHVFDVNPAYRMPGGGRRGGGSGGGTTITNAGLNPPNGVVFNYYLKEITDSSKLSIELMDKNKKIIKTFSTSSKDNKIEIGKGMNQFEWDMNYPVAEKVDGLILWNGFVGGPKAAPGNYSAKFKSGKDSMEIPFIILPDPNYKTSQAEYEEQFNHLITIRDKSSEIMKAIKNIREVRQQMNDFSERVGKEDLPKEVKEQIDTVNKQIKEIEEALHQTKAKSGQDVLNFPIKLDDKLSSIYNAAAAGQSGLSRQSKDAYAELVVQIDEQLNKLKKIMSEDVAKLNKLIHEKTLPVIGVKKEVKE
jgi:Mg2+ and Co2+ transporter CorA